VAKSLRQFRVTPGLTKARIVSSAAANQNFREAVTSGSAFFSLATPRARQGKCRNSEEKYTVGALHILSLLIA